MKKFKKLISIILVTIMFCGCLLTEGFAEGEALLGDIDGDGKISTKDARSVLRMASGVDPENLALADLDGDGFVSVEDAVKTLYEATNIGGVVIPDKNGENYLSDEPDNEFIKIIAKAYDIDEEALVAIYSVPDSGTNYVLQFGNKGTSFNKKYPKNADNLVMVYHIGIAPKREISYTDGKLTGGKHHNCTASEGWMVFGLVKTEVMAQYPTYFN